MLSSETKALKLQDGQRSRALSFAWREVQEAVTDAKEGRGEVPAATRWRQRWQHGEVVGVFLTFFDSFLFSNLPTAEIITWSPSKMVSKYECLLMAYIFLWSRVDLFSLFAIMASATELPTPEPRNCFTPF